MSGEYATIFLKLPEGSVRDLSCVSKLFAADVLGAAPFIALAPLSNLAILRKEKLVRMALTYY
jgi:hypothetical protein